MFNTILYFRGGGNLLTITMHAVAGNTQKSIKTPAAQCYVTSVCDVQVCVKRIPP